MKRLVHRRAGDLIPFQNPQLAVCANFVRCIAATQALNLSLLSLPLQTGDIPERCVGENSPFLGTKGGGCCGERAGTSHFCSCLCPAWKSASWAVRLFKGPRPGDPRVVYVARLVERGQLSGYLMKAKSGWGCEVRGSLVSLGRCRGRLVSLLDEAIRFCGPLSGEGAAAPVNPDALAVRMVPVQ